MRVGICARIPRPAGEIGREGVGNWDADPERYPNGMKPVADAAHRERFEVSAVV